MIGRKISLSEGKTYVLMDSLGGTTVAKDLEKALSAGMTVLGSIEPQQSISTFSSSSAVVRRTGSGTAKDGVSEFSPKSSLAGYETVPSNMKGAALSSSKRPTINGTKVAEAYAYVPPPPPYAGVTDEDDCIFKGANGNYYSQNTMSPSNMYPKYSVTGYSRSLFPNYERVCWVPFEGRWFLYWEEKTVNVKVYSNHSKAQSPTSVKPYQKFSLTLSGSCTLDEFEVDSDGGTRETTQLTYSSLSAAVELFGMNANADVLDGSETHLTNPDYVWSRSASDELQSSHQDYAIDYGGFSIEIQVEGWDEEYYAVEKKAGQSAAVYAGKAVGQAFADGYTLVHYAENDYKTLSDVVQTSLSLDGITPQTFSEGDAVGFSYSYSGEAVQYVSNDKVIGLAAGSAKFDLMTRRTSYKVGETIKLSEIDIKSAGHLKYSDGTTIAISALSWTDEPYATCSLGSGDEIEIGEETAAFSMTYHLSPLYFNAMTFSFDCFVEGFADDYVTSVEIADAKTAFHEGETLDFGTAATLRMYNSDGELQKTVPYSSFAGTITQWPDGYGEKIGESRRIDRAINAPFKAGLRDVDWSYVVDYMEPQLVIGTAQVKKRYILKDSFVLDTSGFTAKYRLHANSEGLGTVRDVDCSSACTFSHPEIDVPTGQKSYTVTASYENQYGQVSSASYQITVVRYEPVQIRITGDSDATEYWDNGQDVFHYPSGLTFERRYSDDTYEEVELIGRLEFYRDQGMANRLIVGASVVRRSDGNRIYVRDPETGTSGSFAISFKEDPITSLYVANTVQFTLGNKLNSIRDSLVVMAHYESGVPDSEYTNYDFKENGILMAEGTVTLVVDSEDAHVGSGEYQVAAGKIEFIKPHIASIAVELNGFQTAYNNQTDSIDCTPIRLKVSYEGAEYVQTCSYHAGETFSSDSDFLVEADETQFSQYVYDGSQKLSIDMGEYSEMDVALTFKVRNAFDHSDETNSEATQEVTVLEILEVTGISLLKAKTDYLVGETFLSDSDDTSVQIYYKDANGQQKKLVVRLNSGFAAINVFPAKGTVFSTVATGRTVTVSAATNYNVKAEYLINVSARYSYGDTKTHNLVAVKADSYRLPNGEVIENHYLLVERTGPDGYENTRLLSDGSRVLAIGKDFGDVGVLGYLEDCFDPSKNARVILFKDYVAPIRGGNNCTVRFPCYVEGNSDRIDKCHFGILFGNNNAKNRLFLSGNPDYPNCDWHSSEVTADDVGDDGMVNGNFSYFEDESYCFYGETDNRVVGYDIVSNDRLLVLKSPSDKETTVYFRTPTLVTAIDGSGTAVSGIDGETLYEEQFPLVKGNNSVSGIGPKAITNFNGDSLFVSSEKMVCGLDLTGIVGDNQRYANSRSRAIDADLRQRDVSDCLLWNDGEYLMLALEEKTFVAHRDMVSNGQYEWWQIDVGGAKCFIRLGDRLFFGTADGSFRAFGQGFCDLEKRFLGEDGGTLATEGDGADLVFVSSQEAISFAARSEEPSFMPISGSNTDSSFMYCQIARIGNVASGNVDFLVDSQREVLVGRFLVNGSYSAEREAEVMATIREGRDYFLNHAEGDNEIACVYGSPIGTYYRRYRLKLVQAGEDGDGWAAYERPCFRVLDAETGGEAEISELYRATLCERVDFECSVADVDEQEQSFSLRDGARKLDLVRYADQSTVKSFKGELRRRSPVEAYWITKPYDMGSLDYFKTVWQWTLTNDTSIPSELELCYASNKIPFESMKTISAISKDSDCFDFGSLSFAKVDFDKKVVPRTYTNQRLLSRLKFICFGFRNYSGTNAVLSSMSIVYTVPLQSSGGD